MYDFGHPSHQEDWLYCQQVVSDVECAALTLFANENPQDVGTMQNMMDEVDRQNEILSDACGKMEALYDASMGQEIRRLMKDEPELLKRSVALLKELASSDCSEVLRLYSIAKHRISAFEKSMIRFQSRLKFMRP